MVIFKKFKKNLVESYRDLFHDLYANTFLAHKKSTSLVLVALTGIFYIAFVFVDSDDTGEPSMNPDGLLEHLGVFILSGVLLVFSTLLFVALLAFLEAVNAAKGLDWLISVAGLPSHPRAFKQATASIRALESTPTLESSVSYLKRALETKRKVSQLPQEPKRSLAGVRVRRLTARADGALVEIRGFFEAESSLESAVSTLVGHKANFPDRSDCSNVYVALSGPIHHPALLLVVNRFRVAGPDPLEQVDSSWGDSLQSEGYGFASLLCMPKWLLVMLQDSLDSLGERTPRLTDSAPAGGTFKDTVSYLWRQDRWSKYHQPTRVADAARRLDLGRNVSDANYVPFK